MIDRVSTFCLVCSVLLAAALPFEFRSELTAPTAPSGPVPKSDEKAATQNDQPAVDHLTATILARPLFSPTRRPAEAAPSDHSGTPLSDMRLTGILITPDQHLAIFAPAGGKPLVRSEGDMISDWRIESIATDLVSLTGPTGAATLEPKADPNLVRAQAARPVAASPQPAAAAANPPPAPAANAPVRPPIPIRRSNR
jgi:hypothetical protein